MPKQFRNKLNQKLFATKAYYEEIPSNQKSVNSFPRNKKKKENISNLIIILIMKTNLLKIMKKQKSIIL